MIVVVRDQATASDIQKAREEYRDYIKVTVDLEIELVAIGGEYHADAEKVLIEEYDCKSENILGGGYNVKTKEYEFVAMINIRPRSGNNSMEILDQHKRSRFEKIAQEKLMGIESFI